MDLSTIIKLSNLKLPTLIGIVLGVALIVFVRPETATGAFVWGAIGFMPSVLIGALISKMIKRKKSQNRTESNNDA